MGLETQKKDIGGVEYTVHQLTAKPGRRAFTRLVKVIGPAWIALEDGEQKQAVELLAKDISEDDVDYFCDLFAESTEVKGVKLSDIFDIHFRGKYRNMIEWLVFCIKVNFGDFTGGLGTGESPQAQ